MNETINFIVHTAIFIFAILATIAAIVYKDKYRQSQVKVIQAESEAGYYLKVLRSRENTIIDLQLKISSMAIDKIETYVEKEPRFPRMNPNAH